MTTTDTIIELDTRTTDGIEVQLLWHRAENRLAVTAADVRSGEVLEVTVGERESALDVFHHPYAYAAFRGIVPRSEAERLVSSLG